MRRHRWFGPLPLSLSLLAACSVSPGGSDFAGSATSSGTGSETGDSAESDSSTTGDESSGPRFDVGDTDSGTGGDDSGGGVAPSCDNIDQFPDTSVGCVFFAHAPNAFVSGYNPGNQHGLGISVGNPSEQPAHIRIEDMRGPGNALRTMTEFDLAHGESRMTVLNGANPPGLFPDEVYHIDNPYNDPESYGLSGFRITSDVPVTATQIFPVGGAQGSYIADSSLLLPLNSLGEIYMGANYDDPNKGGNFFNGWAIVVGTEDGTKIDTALESFTLDAFEGRMLDLGFGGEGYETQGVTGLYVVGDKPFVMFTGNYCADVPIGVGTCDHIEEQMVPLATWGTKYVGARHPRRGGIDFDENVYWRVIAGSDDTQISLDPPVWGNGTIELEKTGDWAQFGTAEPFVASSDAPFLLVEYMSGVEALGIGDSPLVPGAGTSGDPAMAQMVPVDQWLTKLPFVTDTSYRWDFVTITREAGTQVTLDCLGVVSDDHFSPISASGYEIGHVTLDEGGKGGEGNCKDGAQYLTATGPVGVVIGGVDYRSSYLAPGGLKLDDLWEPPPMPPEG